MLEKQHTRAQGTEPTNFTTVVSGESTTIYGQQQERRRGVEYCPWPALGWEWTMMVPELPTIHVVCLQILISYWIWNKLFCGCVVETSIQSDRFFVCVCGGLCGTGRHFHARLARFLLVPTTFRDLRILALTKKWNRSRTVRVSKTFSMLHIRSGISTQLPFCTLCAPAHKSCLFQGHFQILRLTVILIHSFLRESGILHSSPYCITIAYPSSFPCSWCDEKSFSSPAWFGILLWNSRRASVPETEASKQPL